MAPSAGMSPTARRTPKSSIRKPGFFWLTLVLAVAFSVMYLSVGWIIYHDEPDTEDSGWSAHWSDGEWVVTRVDPHGHAGGKLEPGDRLRAFNGDVRAAIVGPRIYEHFLAPGPSYALRVVRGSVEREVSLSWPTSHRQAIVSTVLSYLLVSLSFFGVAVLLGLSRPEDRVTQLGCLTCFAVALRLLPLALWPYEGAGRLESNANPASSPPGPQPRLGRHAEP